jgi:hypothetical protein
MEVCVQRSILKQRLKIEWIRFSAPCEVFFFFFYLVGTCNSMNIATTPKLLTSRMIEWHHQIYGLLVPTHKTSTLMCYSCYTCCGYPKTSNGRTKKNKKNEPLYLTFINVRSLPSSFVTVSACLSFVHLRRDFSVF